jgi:hypothetical protein
MPDGTQTTAHVITVPGFLKELGICPELITVSSYGYTHRDDTSAEEAIMKLSHIQRECLPLATELFTSLPTETNPIENILHRLVVAKIAFAHLLETSVTSSSYTSSLSTKSSTTEQFRSLREIILSIREDTVRSTYWNLLDIQPDATKQTVLGITHEAKPPKHRKTLSSIMIWLGVFKTAQAKGDITRAPEALAQEIEAQFNVRKEQIRTNRTTVLAHVAPGLAALRTLKQIAEQGQLSPEELYETPSRSGCRSQ